MLLTAGAIFILLLLSAFFSGSETALTAASRPLMHQLEQKGNRRARLVNRLHGKEDKLIGSILLGNNLVNILSSALATSMMIALFGEAGVVYATLAMTVLVLIFAEILPKTYAFRHPNRSALAVVRLVNGLVLALTPFVLAINFVVRMVLKVFGLDERGVTGHTAQEELRGAIDLHARAGAIRQEKHMLRSVLDLAEVQVGEIMVHRKSIAMIDAEAPIEQILSEVLESPYTRLPIWKGEPDNIVGIIHAKALVREVRSRWADGKPLESIDIAKVAAKPWFVPEYTPLSDQLQAFRARREHIALVVDEYGTLLGIVTLEDILEEIVGDISDEHDLSVPGVHLQADGSFVVQGSVTLRDLNRQFDWRLPDEEASTVAGLILNEARRIPEPGQSFKFHGFRFEILRRHRHQITSVRITPPKIKRAANTK